MAFLEDFPAIVIDTIFLISVVGDSNEGMSDSDISLFVISALLSL